MSAVEEITSSLPIDQIAEHVGAEPAEVRAAVSVAVPALLGGLHANAADPSGASSILEALSQHDPGLADQVASHGVGQVDTAEGEKIAAHIFGASQQQVASQLGGLASAAGGSDLIRKLLPLLAPIVMSYLAKQVSGAGGATASGNPVQQILEQVLRGAGQGGVGSSTTTAGGSGGLGSVLGDVLGGLLGKGRR